MNNKHHTTASIYTTSFIILLVISYLMYQARKQDTELTQTQSPSKVSFFITSKNPGAGGNLGGLSGADTYCTALAEKAGHTGKTWRAYLSTVDNGEEKGVHARDRIGNGPWYNTKGVLIASNIEELHVANGITKVTALNEYGEVISGRGDTPNQHDILTGSTELGVALATTTDTTCRNWTSSLNGSALVGHHDRIGRDDSAPMKSWNSSHLTRGCSAENFVTTGGAGLFYCFAE